MASVCVCGGGEGGGGGNGTKRWGQRMDGLRGTVGEGRATGRDALQ